MPVAKGATFKNATDLKTSSLYMEELWCLFVNVATAFRQLPTTSEVHRLMLEGGNRRRRRKKGMSSWWETPPNLKF
jgi:hypothetical protein